mmetsp:Transcript_3307/g.5016  ORF Transcript_3307/g.5016 Transcript_3307/m.5016 type:complete len:274 (-) Transcript_3307:143-964(-)
MHALRHWPKQAKKLIILSNSSAPSAVTLAKLPKLGFDPKDFFDAVTSGEEAAKYIREHYSGKKGFFIMWHSSRRPSPLAFIEKCGDVTVVDSLEDADFIVFHGTDVIRGPGKDGEAKETDFGNFQVTGDFTQIDPILKRAAELNLVGIGANPDFVAVQPNGKHTNMPGKLSQRYEKEFGGKVVPFGKPYKEHFQACVDRLGLPKEKVIHVGDSLHHDVAGANAAGIDSLFVTSGIHAEEMDAEFGKLPSKEKLEETFQKHHETPTYAIALVRM